jgi:signal transduction histidine kinase
LVAAALVALLVGPLRALLQRRARRLVYGMRAEPYAALSGLGRQLAATLPDDDVPTTLVSTIREALRAPYVALAVGVDGAFPIAAEQGRATPDALSLPVHHHGEQVGILIVGYDAGHPLSAPDRALLTDLTSHAGSAIHGLQLTASLRRGSRELQDAREQLVQTREEERRRLRRDLHDGLGPTLSGVAFSTDAARNQLSSDPAAADALLEKLRADTTSAIAEVRRLVEGLRPPALDELGLLGAVRQHAATLHADGGAPLQVTIAAPEPLPELSAAAEVTAYRIVVEALTNVARHAAATTAAVELSVAGDDLRVSVQDDGRGSNTWRPGVGMSSMRERAEQVGGTLSARSRADGGRVEARIPRGTR